MLHTFIVFRHSFWSKEKECFVETASVHPWPSTTCWASCQIFLQFDDVGHYKKLSASMSFFGYRLSANHTLVKGINWSYFVTDLDEIWNREYPCNVVGGFYGNICNKWSFACSSHTWYPVWVKFGVRDLNRMLSMCQFHTDHCREGHTFLVAITEDTLCLYCENVWHFERK